MSKPKDDNKLVLPRHIAELADTQIKLFFQYGSFDPRGEAYDWVYDESLEWSEMEDRANTLKAYFNPLTKQFVTITD